MAFIEAVVESSRKNAVWTRELVSNGLKFAVIALKPEWGGTKRSAPKKPLVSVPAI